MSPSGSFRPLVQPQGTTLLHHLAHDSTFAELHNALRKGSAGTGNPASELTRTPRFRGVVAHVQTFGQYPQPPEDLLYRAGIVAQLGLSSHLINVGFADAWCARHVGLCVADGLA
jgi:hypothetical protein